MTLEMVLGAGALAAMLRLATPILLAALGGVLSERAGVVNIALEGSMLVGAFVGIVAAEKSGNVFVGIAAAMLAGTLLAAVHAFAAIEWRSDQIVSGMALNILALGLTSYLNFQMYGTTGTPADVPNVPTFANQSVLVWASLGLVPLVHLFLFGTVTGLRLRAVGEHPRAADTVGVSVRAMRYGAVLASGALAGLAGAYLSLAVAHSFTDGMTAGRGFIALAAVIFGKWSPLGALIAALIFGYGNALSVTLQGATIGDTPVPVQLLGTLPYLLTILAVAGFVGRSRPPAAVGQPYAKEGH